MLNTLLIVGLVGYVVVRRLIGEPLNARDVYVPPLVLTGIGIHALSKVALGPVDVLWLVAGGLVALGFGALRAATTALFERDGVLCQRYTWRTLVVWVVSAAAGLGVGVLAARYGVPAQARPIQLSMGVGLAGEALVTAVRARVIGVPYASENTQGAVTSTRPPSRSTPRTSPPRMAVAICSGATTSSALCRSPIA